MTDSVDIFNDFAVNEDSATKGVWVPYKGDIEFLVAQAQNKNFRRLAQPAFKRHGRLLEQGGELAEAKGKELLIDLIAKTILLGWKGEVKIKGEALTYSVENAKKLLALDGFRDWVDAQAKDNSLFKAVQDEEDAKN